MAMKASSRPEPVLVPVDHPEYVATARMTWDEWLDWEYEHGLTEWVDGVAYVYMSNSDEHQRVVDFLHALLNFFLDWADLGVTRTGPYALRSAGGRAGREPDIMVIGNAQLDAKQSRFMTAAPLVAIEVVSDDSPRRDRAVKFLEYQELGVAEYWIIDPRAGEQSADVFVLDGGRYRALPVEDGVIRSEAIPGFWMRTEWMFAARPRALAAFREITSQGSGPG